MSDISRAAKLGIRLRSSVGTRRSSPEIFASFPVAHCSVHGTGYPVDDTVAKTILAIFQMHGPKCAVDLVSDAKEVVNLP